MKIRGKWLSIVTLSLIACSVCVSSIASGQTSSERSRVISKEEWLEKWGLADEESDWVSKGPSQDDLIDKGPARVVDDPDLSLSDEQIQRELANYEKIITLRSIGAPITFEYNSATITGFDSFEQLDICAEILRDKPEVKALIAGHTDNIGSDAFNLDLSRRRANSVRSYLVRHGVPAKRVIAYGYGEKHPVSDNSDEFGRSDNRRVEFIRYQ